MMSAMMSKGAPPMQNPGMASSPSPSAMDAGGDAGCPDGCIPVPLSALAQPNNQEQMQTPQEGDAITFQVDATIDSINGETAYVKPSAVNGTPLEADDNEPSPDDESQEPDDGEGAALRGQADQMSQ